MTDGHKPDPRVQAEVAQSANGEQPRCPECGSPNETATDGRYCTSVWHSNLANATDEQPQPSGTGLRRYSAFVRHSDEPQGGCDPVYFAADVDALLAALRKRHAEEMAAKDERIAVVENEYEHLREVMAADLRRYEKETAALRPLAEIGRLAVELGALNWKVRQEPRRKAERALWGAVYAHRHIAASASETGGKDGE